MRSAMFTGKRRVLTGLIAASLLAALVTETGQSPAAAKTIESASVANSVRTGPYGPVCTTPSATTIKLLNTGAARTYSIATLTACANYAVPSASPTPSISPTPRPSSTTTATPTPYPSPSLIALPALPPSNSISYSIGANPAGVAATISGDTLTVSTTAAAVDTTLEILATHAYLDPLEGSYEFIDTNAISIPLNIRDAAPPTCQIFTTSTSINVPIDVDLAYEDTRTGGCRGGYGVLSYTVFAAANGSVGPLDADTATFTPAAGFQTPADNTIKATFAVTATDEYGQTSVALNQSGGEIAGDGATITVNVSEPRNCGGWVPKTETIFNNPLASSSRDGSLSNSRFAITNRINNMIDCAQPGSTIAMSWFSFTDDNMVNHLIQADRAGVNVRVLVNSHATKRSSSSFTAVNTLRAALGSNVTAANANASENDGSWLASCDSGCLTPPAPPGVVFPDESEGEYPALHSKFFLITKAGVPSKTVVGISSVNPTYEQARVGFNNASIVVNDKTLFESMNRYYADLANAARGAGKVPAYRQLKTDSKTTSYYVYPKSGSDDVLTMLRDIKCTYKVGKKTMRTQIYVNMFVFTRNAPAMELWRKAFSSKANNGGCNVHIIYTDMDQRIKALNTRTGKYDFIPNGGKPSSWGVADCLSTMPTKKGKAQKLTAPGLVFDSDKNRMVTAKVCKNGSLQGAIPTINKKGGYCWFNAKKKSTGGSLSMCISSPMKITANDKADNRAKLEPISDSSGRRWYSHQKYIAIDGMYGKKGKQTRQQIVISGTPNITSPGQRWNDEILTFTTSAEIYKQYVDNFKDTKAAILRRSGPSSEGRAEARW